MILTIGEFLISPLENPYLPAGGSATRHGTLDSYVLFFVGGSRRRGD
jgi:hypothetical protein